MVCGHCWSFWQKMNIFFLTLDAKTFQKYGIHKYKKMKLLKYPKKMQVNIRSWNGECFSKHKQKNIIQKNDRCDYIEKIPHF